MSFTFNDEISYSDSPNLDAFGRLRTSEIETIVENFFPFDKEPLQTNELIVGTASATWTSGSTVELTVGNSSGDRVVRQSRVHATYQAGKSQLVLMSGILNDQGGVSGIVSRIGYFDNKDDKSIGLIRGNGLFFELDGTDLYTVVRKTNVSTGVQSDTRTIQSNWNLDTLDGSSDSSNPSGLEIDASKAQVFVVDFEWLGVGRVRFGFYLKGRIYYCHEITNYNVLTDTYINTPVLPMRWEMENVGGVANTSNAVQICGSVNTEAPYSPLGKIFSVDRGTTARSVGGTLVPLISIRLKANYNRREIKILATQLFSVDKNQDVRYGIYLNSDLTGASWIDLDNLAAQYDISATSINISNALLIDSGYFSNVQSISSIIDSVLNLSSDIDGTPNILTIAAQSIGGSVDCFASIRAQEKL